MQLVRLVHKNIFEMAVTYKAIFMLVFLAALPNLLGTINIPTVFGFKIHTFQVAIFIAAAIYGPIGGVVSGGFGSIFTAFTLSNPYIIIGNMILGYMAGFLIRNGFGVIRSVLIAYATQMPWLYLTDVYLAGMSHGAVIKIMIALLASNIIWGIVAKYTYKPIKQILQ